MNLKLFIADIKSIARVPVLLCSLLSPIIITLLLLYIYPLFSGLTWAEDTFSHGRYYSVIAITLISAIPFISGLLFSFIHLTESHSSDNSGAEKSNKDSKNHLIERMSVSAFLSFILVLPVIYLTDAVSTEGWLRGIFAASLLAAMAPFIFLFVTGLNGNRRYWKLLSLISILFLITVPAGLLLHHPWNYFTFFSPYYWLCWAWVIASPAESLMYGLISIAITSVSMLIFYRYFLRN